MSLRCNATASEAVLPAMTLAPHPFWLDGGYDFESVQACPYHPEHRWVTLRLGDVLAYVRNPDEELTICRGCYVPRCGYVADVDRCTLWRHHETAHVHESGTVEPLGGLWSAAAGANL